ASGYEEWLHLEAGAVNGDHTAAVWEIDGASPRQRGDAVELTDESGSTRVVVTAPKAFAEGGRPIEVKLVANAKSIELWVEADNEAVLVDPLWTLVGSMTTGRGYPGVTLLASGKVLAASGF